MKFKNKDRLFVLLTAFLIFVFSFGIRIYKLSQTPIYPDEITWMVRGRETALAIRTLNFDYFNNAWWNKDTDTEAIALPLTVISGFPQIYLAKDASVLSLNLFNDYIIGRIVLISIVSVFFSLYYFTVSKLFGKKIALISTVFFAIDPIFLANSKLIMNDGLLTVFIFISLLSYLQIKDSKLSIVASSFFLALSFLTKPTALLLLLPFSLQILLKKENYKEEVSKFLFTLLLSFIFISLLWPTSWNSPLFAIPEYLVRQSQFVGKGINSYFLGRITDNPPMYYYLFLILIRIPVVVLIGSIGFGFVYILKKRKNNSLDLINVTILLYTILYILFMGLSSKKLGIRYVLPVFPFIYLFFAQGVNILLKNVKGKFTYAIIIVLLLFEPGYFLLKQFPYYDFYYSYLIGKPSNARKLDLVGLCTGSKKAVDYILGCYPQVKDIAVVGCGSSTIPYYYPYAYTENWKGSDVVIAEAYNFQLKKNDELDNFYQNYPPTKIFKANGIDLVYVWVGGSVKSNCPAN